MNTWYELEIMPLSNKDGKLTNFYKDELERSDMNAGFDLYSLNNIRIKECTIEFISFDIVARLIKVESIITGNTTKYIKSDSHFWLVPHSSIFDSGLIMANSNYIIDKDFRGELKVPVWCIVGETYVFPGDKLFQIVAPNMGWIRNVRIINHIPETRI